MRYLAVAAFSAAFFVPATGGAFALPCVPREAVFDKLRESYAEVPAFRGVTASGALLEVLVGPSGSFTVFLTRPDGLTCPVATGEGWRDVPRTSDDPAA